MTNTLRVARAIRGLNQELTAKALKWQRDRYFRIEKGYADPTRAEMEALEKLFGTPIEELFPGADTSQVA